MAVVKEFTTKLGSKVSIDDEYCAGKTDEERAADLKRLNRIIYELLRGQKIESEVI